MYYFFFLLTAAFFFGGVGGLFTLNFPTVMILIV